MENELATSTNNMSINELVRKINSLVADINAPDINEFKELSNDQDFQKLYTYICDLRKLSYAIQKGELGIFVKSKGFILANLKSLQSNLRHLTWQTQRIAEGDFSQKVDFLGDFSEAFNKMTDRLDESSTKLMTLANTDALTHIPNRLSLQHYLEKIFRSTQDVYIFMMDLDHFKQINDTYGHVTGDGVLVHVSDVLREQLRGSDFIARYGGEEFVAILLNTDKATAGKIAERILSAVRVPFVVEGHDIQMTISIGIGIRRESDESYTDCLERSDKALYAAKSQGRNRYCFYEEREKGS